MILYILLAVVILVVAFVGFQFFRYFLSYYSITTKRRFTEVMFNSFYRSSYRLGQKVEKIIKKQTGWVLFDLSISQPSNDPAKDQLPNLTVDSLAITEFGVIALFYQNYAGKIVSQINDDANQDNDDGSQTDSSSQPNDHTSQTDGDNNWIIFETTKDDSLSKIIPSPLPAIEKITALLLELFASENLHIKQIIPMLVFANKCDISDVQLNDGMRKVHYGKLTKEIKWIQLEQDKIYDRTEWLDATRALVPFANSVIAKPNVGKRGIKEVVVITHDFINRKNPAISNAEFMRKAGKIAAAKEELDALTLQRIIEIGKELEGDCSQERQAILAAELQQIAHTNIALNYNFGAAENPFDITPSQEEAEQHAQALNSPSMGSRDVMQTALDSSDFFNQESAEKDPADPIVC